MSDYPAGTVLGAWPVTLGGLELDRVDSAGVEWSLTSFSGWGSPSTSGEVVDRPRAHGAWAPKWFRRPKDMTISLSVDAETPQIRWEAEQRLQAAITEADTLMVVHEETPRRMMVRLNGLLDIKRTSVYTFDAEIPLLALDPLRYGITPRTTPIALGTGAALSNFGTTSAWASYRLNGPLTEPILSDSLGNFMRIDATIPSGSWLVVDTLARQVRMFNEPDAQLRSIFGGNWFAVPPGGTTVSLAATSGSGNAVATVTDTWI